MSFESCYNETMNREEIKQLLLGIEKFSHKNAYKSAILMSPREKEVFVLKQDKGMNTKAISKSLKISENRVMDLTRDGRNKKQIQEELIDYLCKSI